MDSANKKYFLPLFFFTICLPLALAEESVPATAPSAPIEELTAEEEAQLDKLPARPIGLVCQPVSSEENGKPLICQEGDFREELFTYLNLGSLYRLDISAKDSQWVDRVELLTSIPKTELAFGKSTIILRLNSFLRPRDAKDILKNIISRINVIKASPETNKYFRALATSKNIYTLNLEIDLKDFLDAPFRGPSGEVLSASNDSSQPAQAPKEALQAPKEENLLSSIKGKDCESLEATHEENLKRLKDSLDDYEKAKQTLAQKIKKHPSYVRLRDGETLSQLAAQVQQSDCDLCTGAVYFCKSKKLLEGYSEMKNNCRTVFQSKACYNILPASLELPVNECLGLDFRKVQEAWTHRQTLVKKEMASLDEKKKNACGSPAP